MAKPRPGFGHRPAGFLIGGKKGIKSNLAQGDNHAKPTKQFDLFNEVGPAALEFSSARLIFWRRASDRCGNVTIGEFQAIVSMNRLWLIGKSRSVKRSV